MSDEYECDNCGHTADRDELPDLKDAYERLTPGWMHTDKECPECGALCFPTTNMLKQP